MQQDMKKTERIIRNMRYSVKKNHFSYINSNSVLKSLVIRATAYITEWLEYDFRPKKMYL